MNYAILCVNQNRAESGKLCRKWNTIENEIPYSWHKIRVKAITGHTDHNQCVQAWHRDEIFFLFKQPFYSGCFTSSTKWERCHCHEESPYCKDISTTKHGHRCQKWTSTVPHKPNSWMVASLHGKEHQVPNHNFCRAADPNDPKSWCYTTDPV